MRWNGLRRRRLLLIGLVVAPPAFWALLLALVPTDWARSKVVAALARSTGQPVRLGAVRLGALGGVRLEQLEIGQAGPDPGPWLTVTDLNVDLNLAQLLAGRLEPGEVEACG